MCVVSSRVHAKEIPYARYDSSEKLERFIGIKTILTSNSLFFKKEIFYFNIHLMNFIEQITKIFLIK